jgi:hypothetical protein
MKLVRRTGLLALVIGIVTAAVAAAAAIGSPTSFDATFTSSRPGASAGFELSITGAPPAAGTQQTPVVRELVVFPRGTRFDTRAAARCRATPEQLRDQGARPVCPAGSRIGTGVAEGVLGGQTVHFDLVAYTSSAGSTSPPRAVASRSSRGSSDASRGDG